ncbi:hypothetical protein RFI_16642 [Reticulomyxa filosa]|uniref:Uncharacterized protein n=1 Tax=Reticulomyxa filosa TaxID=46433 RepID=X6N493_RETFI|nr:hypothetical protein RFI_16642 [Reticulomyxa filosa]|eukprot:ETO20574.1 hypothetical protein RFI_16642 [Reticulomyxa filosa]
MRFLKKSERQRKKVPRVFLKYVHFLFGFCFVELKNKVEGKNRFKSERERIMMRATNRLQSKSSSNISIPYTRYHSTLDAPRWPQMDFFDMIPGVDPDHLTNSNNMFYKITTNLTQLWAKMFESLETLKEKIHQNNDKESEKDDIQTLAIETDHLVDLSKLAKKNTELLSECYEQLEREQEFAEKHHQHKIKKLCQELMMHHYKNC